MVASSDNTVLPPAWRREELSSNEERSKILCQEPEARKSRSEASETEQGCYWWSTGSARPAKDEAGLAVGCYSCNSFRAGMDGRRMERRFKKKLYEEEDKITDAQENGKGAEPKDRL